MTQKQIVLDMLRQRGSLCLAEVPVNIGYAMRNRIGDLRKDGIPIESAPCRIHAHRSHSIVRYRLTAPVQQEIAL